MKQSTVWDRLYSDAMNRIDRVKKQSEARQLLEELIPGVNLMRALGESPLGKRQSAIALPKAAEEPPPKVSSLAEVAPALASPKAAEEVPQTNGLSKVLFQVTKLWTSPPKQQKEVERSTTLASLESAASLASATSPASLVLSAASPTSSPQ